MNKRRYVYILRWGELYDEPTETFVYSSVVKAALKALAFEGLRPRPTAQAPYYGEDKRRRRWLHITRHDVM